MENKPQIINSSQISTKMASWIKTSKIGSILKSFRNFFRDTLGKMYNDFEAYLYDVWNGTDTRGKIPVSELSVVGHNISHGTGYQAVNSLHFHKIMRSLNFPDDSIFVDIGSGKGKALMLASKYRYLKRVVGVEFSEELCNVARRNLARHPDTRKGKMEFEVHHIDALDYEIKDSDNIFFLFNAFDEVILEQFLKKIIASQKEKNREIWLIYSNPANRYIVEKEEAFSLVRKFRFWGPGRNVLIYRLAY